MSLSHQHALQALLCAHHGQADLGEVLDLRAAPGGAFCGDMLRVRAYHGPDHFTDIELPLHAAEHAAALWQILRQARQPDAHPAALG